MRDIQTKQNDNPTSVGELTAEEWNDLCGEVENAIKPFMELDENDSSQLYKAIISAGAKPIDTIADFRLMEEMPDKVWVSGYYQKGDGAFGSLFFVKGATGTDNGGTIIEAKNATYYLNYKDVVEAKFFGLGYGDDDTDKIQKILQEHSNIYFNKGEYLIKRRGEDSGGVVADLMGDLNVKCDKEAIFYTDGLDATLITLLGADNSNIVWDGGVFDISNSMVSRVVPFLNEYPAPSGKQGETNLSDGLDIFGRNANSITVRNVIFKAGGHWQSAGGDSGLFVDNAKKIIVQNNMCFGLRDSGIYISCNDNGTADVKPIVSNNYCKNCFVGISVKRSTQGTIVENNTLINCVRGVGLERVVGERGVGSKVVFNYFERCGEQICCRYARQLIVQGNTSFRAGCLLEDGTIEEYVDKAGFSISGVESSIFSNNIFEEISEEYSDESINFYMFNFYDFDDGNVVAESAVDCIFMSNSMKNWYGLGIDIGVSNKFYYNIATNATHYKMSGLGTDANEIAYVDNRVLQVTPIAYETSTSENPLIHRRGQTSVGMFFDANIVGLVGGNPTIALRVSNIGTGFNGETPIAKPEIVGSRGDSEGAIKNLLDALVSYGLIIDSTEP